jgi:hypothetical protein
MGITSDKDVSSHDSNDGVESSSSEDDKDEEYNPSSSFLAQSHESFTIKMAQTHEWFHIPVTSARILLGPSRKKLLDTSKYSLYG